MNFFIRKYRDKSAGFSRASAATTQIVRGGGDKGGFRCTQRHQLSQPFGACVNSVVSRLVHACNFSGQYANLTMSFAINRDNR